MTCTTMINTGEAGNKQPLYYDALLSASGPYKTIQDNFMEDHVVFHESNRVSRGYIYISPLNAANECDNRRRSRQFPPG